MRTKLIVFAFTVIVGCKDEVKRVVKPIFVVYDCPVKLNKNEACIFSYDYNYWVADTTSAISIELAHKNYIEYMDSIPKDTVHRNTIYISADGQESMTGYNLELLENKTRHFNQIINHSKK